MSNWGQVAIWIGSIALALWLGYSWFGPLEEETLTEAVQNHHVTVEVTSITTPPATDQSVSSSSSEGGAPDSASTQNSGGQQAQLTLTGTDDLPSRGASITIPAGTVILNASVTGQPLMTATTIVVIVKSGATTVTTDWIPVYCLDQYAAPPISTSDLSLQLPQQTQPEAQAAVAPTAQVALSNGDSKIAVETEPLQRLAACLEPKQDRPFFARQAAIWTVARGYQDMSPDAVRQAFHDGYMNKLRQDVTAEDFDEEIRSELQAKFPAITEDEVSNILDSARATYYTAYDNKATEISNQVFEIVKNQTSDLLGQCGHDTSASALYQ